MKYSLNYNENIMLLIYVNNTFKIGFNYLYKWYYYILKVYNILILFQ